MKVFVTGGSGFVGGYVLQRLVADGHTVVAPCRSQSGCDRISRLGITPLHMDISHSDNCTTAMAGCEAVIHIAAHIKMWGEWSEFVENNINLTMKVLDAAKENNVRRFVHISAASIVLDKPAANCVFDEVAPLTTRRYMPYSASKAKAESLVMAAHSDTLRTVALRPPYIWGSGDAVDGYLGDQVRRNQFAWINHGNYAYATCHVANLTKAIVLALQNEVTGAFFITDDEDITFGRFMTMRLQASGIKPPTLSVPTSVAWFMGGLIEQLWQSGLMKGSPLMTRELVRLIGYPLLIDITRAKRLLAYKPDVSVCEGMTMIQGLHP